MGERFKKVVERDDGWSDLILPNMKGYKMACCDCGLVHELDFQVFEIIGQDERGVFITRDMPDDKAQVGFKARRHVRSTAQKRRHVKPEPK